MWNQMKFRKIFLQKRPEININYSPDKNKQSCRRSQVVRRRTFFFLNLRKISGLYLQGIVLNALTIRLLVSYYYDYHLFFFGLLTVQHDETKRIKMETAAVDGSKEYYQLKQDERNDMKVY